jgi:The  BURPS668_1122 family of deaminases
MQKLKSPTRHRTNERLNSAPKEIFDIIYPGQKFLQGHRFKPGGILSHENAIKPDQVEELTKHAKEFYNKCAERRKAHGIYPKNKILEDAYGNYASANGYFESLHGSLINFGFFAFSNETKINMPDTTQCSSKLVTSHSIAIDNLSTLRDSILDEFHHKENQFDRTTDTEFKLLEYIYRQIQLLGIPQDQYSEIVGRITLESERSICESCANVIRIFKKMFPKIELIIRSYYGDEHCEYQSDGVVFGRNKDLITS